MSRFLSNHKWGSLLSWFILRQKPNAKINKRATALCVSTARWHHGTTKTRFLNDSRVVSKKTALCSSIFIHPVDSRLLALVIPSWHSFAIWWARVLQKKLAVCTAVGENSRASPPASASTQKLKSAMRRAILRDIKCFRCRQEIEADKSENTCRWQDWKMRVYILKLVWIGSG